MLAFLRRGLGRPSVDPRLETLFERGIDPDTETAAVPRSGASTIWPSRDEVLAFARACDAAVLDAIADRPPTPEAIEGLYTALEHEAMHQETLLYMFHRLPYQQKNRGPWSVVRGPESVVRGPESVVRGPESVVRVPAGTARLGANRSDVVFGWDNEFDAHDLGVAAFEIDVLPVTNARFLDFIDAGGYSTRELWDEEGWEWIQSQRVQHPAFWLRTTNHEPRTTDHGPRTTDHEPRTTGHGPRTTDHEPRTTAVGAWQWRGMFEAAPLPGDAPVYVSHAEASAFARWKGRRLMTEAEWHRAAEGATAGHADFDGFDPISVGSRPGTASAHGVHDLVGDGWEWTSTVFAPFAGFMPMRPYPEYSADFFDGRHFVMKGASPATARELIRPSFRNWFRGNYPYVYAKFRTVGR